MNGSIRSGIVCAFALVLAVSMLPARELSIDERVTAQKAIEQVYWNHRIWPKENPGEKPPLSAVMSDQAIRAKVDEYLRKSNALEHFWRRPVTAEQLQAELDRMAKNTKDGATLQELFGALGNDPLLIADTLARESLVERSIRNWYAGDTRFHGELKSTADAALASCATPDCMKSMSGTYRETTLKRRGDRPAVAADKHESTVVLDPDAWAERLAKLASKLSGTAESLAAGQLTGLEETVDAFIVTAILARRDDAITIATVTWPKRPFEVWWSTAHGTVPSTLSPLDANVTLPEVRETACTIDTWSPTPYELPDGGENLAVWTGTEMLVGGSSTIPGGRYNPSTDTWTFMSTANAPTFAASSRTAIWTGTEMIVWGGVVQGTRVNTGGRYNPASDSWASTSTGVNVPLGRQQHTAVWAGTEMIVWGGLDGVASLNTGGRYNPATDGWTATNTSGAPSARHSHVSVWTGTEMIIWGASDQPGRRFNPSSDSWLTMPSLEVPEDRRNETAVWTGTEMIVWGGSDGTSLNTGGRYKPSTNSWTVTSTGLNAPTGRAHHSAVWTGTEMIIWGGVVPFNTQNSGSRYNPSTDTWLPTSTGTNVPRARASHAAVWTGSEMIIWGGDAGANDGGRYVPSTDTWTPTSRGATVPIARTDHSAVWTGTEMIVWGGLGYGVQPYFDSGGRYVPATDSWTPTSASNAPVARYEHTAVWTGTEMLLWGGYGGAHVNTGGRYNPSANVWTATSTGANLPTARSNHTAVWTGTEMIVWGGQGSAYFDTGGRYNPASDGWTAISTGVNVPAARLGQTAIWTGTDMIVWGGIGPGNFNSGGRYNPASNSWSPTSTGANVPTPRGSSTAVWTGTEMIVWGGSDGTSLNTGGRYTPASNTWLPTPTGINVPTARDGQTAIWTGTEMIIWGGSPTTNTGGRYDVLNDTWAATSTGTNVPRARYFHTAVSTGTEMIVWGGESPTSTGGRYCIANCDSPSVWYQDQDGDGYGIASVTVLACAQPPGYAAISGDCDDTSVAAYPGAAEIGNGIDDSCDGSIDEISGISGFVTSDDTLFSWPAQSGATIYEVARSPFSDFHAGCVHNVTASTSWSDPATLAPSGRFYYLVRSVSPFVGSWGRRNPAAERIVCAGCVSTGDWCDDGSVCTTGDTCTGTICGGAPVSCVDALVCTDDSCNPVSGCVYTNNTAPCTDGSVCTINDTCSGGSCSPGTALNCDDGNPCTNDSCNPGSGCVHANNTSACNDGNPCTNGDVCQAGVCSGTLPGAANHLVISQLQVEGINGSDEFIELYNPTLAPVSVAGMSLQFKTGNAGSTTFTVHPLGTSGPSQVPARGWLLVAPSGYDGTPARNDLLSAFNLPSTNGHVFLVSNTTSLSGACPSSGVIIDKVGWGSANCPEDSPASAPSVNNSMLRKPGGACGNGTDTNSNLSDFLIQTPSTPRNSTSPPQP